MYHALLNCLAALSLGLAPTSPAPQGIEPFCHAYQAARQQRGLERAGEAIGLARAPRLLLPH